MEIRSLASTPIEDMIACLVEAFADYFVSVSNDPAYYESRFLGARIDRTLSFGVFDKSKLVGFIWTGVDIHQGMLTAFNAGTGVIKEYRGSGWVDKIYAHALPRFSEKGIRKCLLEVIVDNKRAIRVYERIGFRKIRYLKCFEGKIARRSEKFSIDKIDYREVRQIFPSIHKYSWENMPDAVLRNKQLETFLFSQSGKPKAFVSMNPENGYVAQLETLDLSNPDHVLESLGMLHEKIRIINVDSRRKSLIDSLLKYHIKNNIDQHEMEMYI